MANVFDQFDAAPSTPQNVFDQFDVEEPATDLRTPQTSFVGDIGRGAASIAANLGVQSVAGLAGIADTAFEFAKGAQRGPGGPDFLAPADTVRAVESKGQEFIEPLTEAGRTGAEAIAKPIEALGKGIKFVLSAVPLVISGQQEAKTFREIPLGDYLGELAEEKGASPLLATLASLSPEIALTALGLGGVSKAGKVGQVVKRPPVPTIGQLKNQATQLYKLVDDSGTTISKEAFQTIAKRIEKEMRASGVRAKLTPKTNAALKELAKDAKAGQLTLSKAEELRRVFKQGQSSIDTADAAASGRLVRKWDEFIENLKPGQLSGSPNAVETAQYLKSARSLWSRSRKTEVIEDLIERAGINAGQFSGSGFENALTTQFRQLARNKKKMRTFTQAEQAAIKGVAKGGPLSTKAFRFIGKLAPTGVVSGGFGAGLGFALAGPAGAFIVPAVGGLSRLAAAGRTAKAAKKVSELTARGAQ